MPTWTRARRRGMPQPALHDHWGLILADAVGVFPSDQYVSDDTAFMAHVAEAFEIARERPELVILLGPTPPCARTAATVPRETKV